MDCPSLRHMCDVVVFPIKGVRPAPDELSGSDLDGDLFHVIWGVDLLPTEENRAPMNYKPVKAPARNEEVTSEHMIDFQLKAKAFECAVGLTPVCRRSRTTSSG